MKLWEVSLALMATRVHRWDGRTWEWGKCGVKEKVGFSEEPPSHVKSCSTD